MRFDNPVRAELVEVLVAFRKGFDKLSLNGMKLSERYAAQPERYEAQPERYADISD